MIKRLRAKYSEEELKQIYDRPHNASNWHDHLVRVSTTIEVARWAATGRGFKSAADLSCGNAAIIDAIPEVRRYKGDYAIGYEFTGPIENTIKEIPNVDLFILSETLEHLDEPEKVLWEIRQKTDTLILSTPDDAGDDPNPEHYWSWDTDDIESMLKNAGFKPFVLNQLRLYDYLYDFQIWGAR